MLRRASSDEIHDRTRPRVEDGIGNARDATRGPGIHMSDIPAFPYAILWGERRVVSVANLTRRDGEEFLALAPRVPVRPSVETFPLERANEALARLREGRISGAAVLVVQEPRG